jgi:hypothetical protein
MQICSESGGDFVFQGRFRPGEFPFEPTDEEGGDLNGAGPGAILELGTDGGHF